MAQNDFRLDPFASFQMQQAVWDYLDHLETLN
jgi:hypothetical protein